jgi:hypothetical protein
MTVNAYCPFCEKAVAAHTILEDDEVKRALERDGDIEVMHMTDHVHEGDDRWKLIRQEKANLGKTIAEGLLGTSAKAS